MNWFISLFFPWLIAHEEEGVVGRRNAPKGCAAKCRKRQIVPFWNSHRRLRPRRSWISIRCGLSA